MTTDEKDAWRDETMKAVAALARKHGWDIDNGDGRRAWKYSSMGSRYTTLVRTRDDEDERQECEHVRVRVSTHPTAYCTEEISLCPVPGGDDHTLADLERRLAAPFRED